MHRFFQDFGNPLKVSPSNIPNGIPDTDAIPLLFAGPGVLTGNGSKRSRWRHGKGELQVQVLLQDLGEPANLAYFRPIQYITYGEVG